MITALKFSQIREASVLKEFSNTYTNCSGLPIPDAYLYDPQNRVFGIYYGDAMIGGFILGNGPQYRTLNFFAADQHRPALYGSNYTKAATEICCFWIEPVSRTKTLLNLFVWLCMAYALKRYGSSHLLFGTCSRSLARLYSVTPHSILIHQDFLNNKNTFIFWGRRSCCITGVWKIVRFKLRRIIQNTAFKLKRGCLIRLGIEDSSQVFKHIGT